MSWPPKGSFGSRTASPLRAASADTPGRVAQRGGAPSQQGVLAAGVILLREPEEGEMEVLIGRYEVINAFRSERHRKCVPMRFAGEYHFPGGAKRQTDLGPLQTACTPRHATQGSNHPGPTNQARDCDSRVRAMPCAGRELHEEFGVGVHLGTRGAGMQASLRPSRSPSLRPSLRPSPSLRRGPSPSPRVSTDRSLPSHAGGGGDGAAGAGGDSLLQGAHLNPALTLTLGPALAPALPLRQAHVALCSSGDKEKEPASTPLHARRAERSSAPSTLQGEPQP